jgi:hypothetical protein
MNFIVREFIPDRTLFTIRSVEVIDGIFIDRAAEDIVAKKWCLIALKSPA